LETKVNAKTSVRIHKNNPKGIPYENPVCVGLPRSLTHDREHCMQPGGGMEGKTPWARNKRQKEVAAAADASPSTTSSSTTPAGNSDRKELACAIIEELSDDKFLPSNEDISCIAGQTLSTILDSGTTSTLIMNCDFFWSYSNDS